MGERQALLVFEQQILQKVPARLGQLAASTVDEVSGTLTTDKLVDLNKRFDIDKDDAEDIAKDYLAEEGLN